jgi:hypothetical protein
MVRRGHPESAVTALLVIAIRLKSCNREISRSEVLVTKCSRAGHTGASALMVHFSAACRRQKR